MVHNQLIKCQVCSSITRVRLQVGWQEEHPIVVACGKCGTSLCGKVMINQKSLGLNYHFDNADFSGGNDKAEFLIECSGEFPVFKQCKEEEIFVITPFIRFMNRSKTKESYEEFCSAVNGLKDTADGWTGYKRILDLFLNNSPYLSQEIKKIFTGEFFQCRDDFEILRAVHMIEVHGFFTPLRQDLIEKQSISNDAMKMDGGQLKKLIDFFASHDGYHLDEMQSMIYKLMDKFINIYQALIPAISLQYCKEDSVNFESEGSTTSTFDTIKEFYLDVYEALGNLLVIPVALNNIKYRGNFDELSSVEGSKARSLTDFIGLTKANRYHYCLEDEIYTGFLEVCVNAKLRNAIGHNDVEYDTVSQSITYIPSPRDRTKKKMEYLLIFENEAVHMFQGLLVISEYLYKLRQISLMFEGKKPISLDMGSRKNKKIGRNALCPCGSGKKYKYCHGKN